MSDLLPPGFEALEPFAIRWAGATAADRANLRSAFSNAERDAFHTACAPLLVDGLRRLDQTALGEQDESERRLMHLLLTFAHVSLAVEVQGDAEDNHRQLRASMRIICAPADL